MWRTNGTGVLHGSWVHGQHLDWECTPVAIADAEWEDFLASQGSPAQGTLAYAQARFDFTDDGSILEEEDL